MHGQKNIKNTEFWL